MFLEKFYLALGRYLYALVMVDGELSEKEIRTFETFIQNETGHLNNTDEFDDVAFLILSKLSFYNALKDKISIQVASDEFILFLNEHSSKITPKNRALARNLISKVEHSYRGASLLENQLIDEVKLYL